MPSKLEIDILANTAAAKRELQGLSGEFRKFAAEQDNMLQKVGATAGGFLLALGVMRVTQALSDGASALFGYSSQLQQNSIAFTTMTGSVEMAQKHLTDLKTFARETPFQFGDLVEYSKRLQAMGTDTDDVVSTLRVLGNVAAGVGMEKLPQLVLAYGQVQTATKLTGNEMRQFKEAGVPLMDALAKAYGKTAKEIEELTSDGRIGFESVKYAMAQMTEEGGRIGPQMENQAKTWATASSNIIDNALQIGSEGFSPLFTWITDTTVELADFLTNDAANFASTIKGNLLGVGLAFDTFGGKVHDAGFTLGWFLDHDVRPWASNAAAAFASVNAAVAAMNQQMLASQFAPPGGDRTPGMPQPAGGMFPGGWLEAPLPDRMWAGDDADIAAARAAAAAELGMDDLTERPAAAAAVVKPPPGRPPPLLAGDVKKGGGGGAKAALAEVKEMLPVMEQLNRANAYEAFLVSSEALLKSGNLEQVIADFAAIGKTSDETADAILRMSRNIESEAKRAAEQEVALAKQKAEDTFSYMERGLSAQQALAAQAESTWIKDMGDKIKEAATAGWDPATYQHLLDAYATAVGNTIEQQIEKAKAWMAVQKQAIQEMREGEELGKTEVYLRNLNRESVVTPEQQRAARQKWEIDTFGIELDKQRQLINEAKGVEQQAAGLYEGRKRRAQRQSENARIRSGERGLAEFIAGAAGGELGGNSNTEQALEQRGLSAVYEELLGLLRQGVYVNEGSLQRRTQYEGRKNALAGATGMAW